MISHQLQSINQSSLPSKNSSISSSWRSSLSLDATLMSSLLYIFSTSWWRAAVLPITIIKARSACTSIHLYTRKTAYTYTRIRQHTLVHLYTYKTAYTYTQHIGFLPARTLSVIHTYIYTLIHSIYLRSYIHTQIQLHTYTHKTPTKDQHQIL